MREVSMTFGKTSDYTWVLVTCGKNFQLHTGVRDLQEKLLITHGKVGILEPQPVRGVDIKHIEEKKNVHFLPHW